MSYTITDVVNMVDRLERHLAQAEGMLSTIATAVADISAGLPKRSAGFECPKCHIVHKTEQRLNDHLELIHG